MKTYYRYTNQNTPISDWGHALFAENEEEVKHYGENKYTFNDKTKDIADLKDVIAKAWEEDRINGFNGDFGNMADIEHWQEFDGEEIANEFDPEDIVDAAQAWDTELVMWVWERILGPNGIYAVATYNGAVVFDEDIIEGEG